MEKIPHDFHHSIHSYPVAIKSHVHPYVRTQTTMPTPLALSENEGHFHQATNPVRTYDQLQAADHNSLWGGFWERRREKLLTTTFTSVPIIHYTH